MLILAFVFIVFLWLVVGALQFLICAATPRLRQYALSAALWWAVWGPCSIGLLLLAGLGIVAQSFFKKDYEFAQLHARHLPLALGWGYLTLGVLGTAALATVVAWLHQAVMRRLTFALFRIYATAISAGVGSVFGWCFAWWILSYELRYGWMLGLCGVAALVLLFGAAAFKKARLLRGEAPTTFAWVSHEEYEGKLVP